MQENQDWGGMASRMDACREYAINAGRDREDSAWILTDFDVWMANPFYNGPPVPHPEDYSREWCQDLDQMSADEEEAVREFNQDFPVGGADPSPAPDRELPKDELPF